MKYAVIFLGLFAIALVSCQKEIFFPEQPKVLSEQSCVRDSTKPLYVKSFSQRDTLWTNTTERMHFDGIAPDDTTVAIIQRIYANGMLMEQYMVDTVSTKLCFLDYKVPVVPILPNVNVCMSISTEGVTSGSYTETQLKKLLPQ